MARTVCVTGASGLLASWLVKTLLEKGYHVRGTVRDPDDPRKTSYLLQLPGASERLKLYKADVLSEGVFDDIVEGCEGVFHVASPVFWDAEDPQAEIVDPAVFGTLNVLKACKKSSTVKRLVYTSSASAVCHPSYLTPETVLDESTWSSPEICRQNKFWYALSKTLAEQAAWEFAKSNNIDLVSVAPSCTLGYILPPLPTSSVAEVLQLFKGLLCFFGATAIAISSRTGNGEKLNTLFKQLGYVHLDDVASAQIYVFENSNASGRYICSPVAATNAEFVEVASKFPEYKSPTKVESSGRVFKGYSSKKLEQLGFKFKFSSLESILRDFINDMKMSGRL